MDLRREAPPAAEVVAANMTRPLLLALAPRLLAAPVGTVIASGLLDAEADEVVAAFAPLRERRRLSERGWTAVLLERPA